MRSKGMRRISLIEWLVKMCGNRSRADEFIVILHGAAMFSKAFVQLAFGLPNVLFFTLKVTVQVN